MPPRIPLFQCLKAPNATRSASSTRAFTSSSQCQASTTTQRRKHRDPYAIAQAKARKAANLSRREVLKQERAAALGDPVRGITTPYVLSFDTAVPTEPANPEYDEYLNFFLSKSELDKSLNHSKWLSTPAKEPELPKQDAESQDDETQREKDPLSLDFGSRKTSRYEAHETPEQKEANREEQQRTAEEALRRISSLDLSSGDDRKRVNVMRCIKDFGRHTTDQILPPKPASASRRPHQKKTPRAGPDTGSSEVQIAILTAKIRSLDQPLQGRGRMDKSGKRDLRLLVHRRQKLLRYLRKKERGGPRFQNLVERLGLTEGTWKGEISLA